MPQNTTIPSLNLSNPVFHRGTLSEVLAKTILSRGAASGLFLAAPRRTGKTTFLVEDLKPLLERQGALVIYTDLWAQRDADPGQVIAQAVRNELSKHANVLQRLAKKIGIDKVGLKAGIEIEFDFHSTGKQTFSLADILTTLSDETKQPIVLIIDEAQHTADTKDGVNTMFALKAAREIMNSSGHLGFRLVATGSNPDKLATLCNSRGQAFYGSAMHEFPELGKDFVKWFCDQNAETGLTANMVWPLFHQSGHRPEILEQALARTQAEAPLQENSDPTAFRRLFKTAVHYIQEHDSNDWIQTILALPPLQSAIIRVLMVRGRHFSPFDSNTMKAYTEVIQHIAPETKIHPTSANVQMSLKALQSKGLIWRARRGVYAVEDKQLITVAKRRGLLRDVPALTREAKQRAAPMAAALRIPEVPPLTEMEQDEPQP